MGRYAVSDATPAFSYRSGVISSGTVCIINWPIPDDPIVLSILSSISHQKHDMIRLALTCSRLEHTTSVHLELFAASMHIDSNRSSLQPASQVVFQVDVIRSIVKALKSVLGQWSATFVTTLSSVGILVISLKSVWYVLGLNQLIDLRDISCGSLARTPVITCKFKSVVINKNP